MSDYLFRGSLEELDKDVYELTQLEQERQARKLILIASESTAPMAVREALSSAFQNIYAEGYPDEESRWMDDAEILDYPARLANYRRNSDPRYYKGVEYADTVEALARRRVAQTFAANGITADEIYVNVQALSGGPANNAVYHALINLGDTVMGLNLLHGGHLSHGSSVNRSGKWFKAVHYTIDENEKIDYEAIRILANEHKPKLLIAGYSSYSWMPDWKKFREIADEVGAYLLTDISHIGGLVAAGVVPSPIGFAHVVMSTTHKSIDGPRGAVLLTTDSAIAKKIDKAVFPGEQGGPHVNVFAGLALTFKLTQTKQFKKLQEQTLKNAKAMADQFEKHGLRVPFGGTNTHLVNVDCTSIVGEDGTKLSGDQASRILDIVGVVVNRNTIPGDKNSMDPSGIRLGTPWITQRGFDEKKTRELANIMADVLLACAPHSVDTVRKGRQRRAKLDFNVLNEAKLKIRKLCETVGIDFKYKKSGYPHYYFIDDVVGRIGNPPKNKNSKRDAIPLHVTFELSGKRIRQVLDYAVSSDLSALKKGKAQATEIATPKGVVKGVLAKVDDMTYQIQVPAKNAGVVATWLRDLSDGYTSFNLNGEKDFSAKRMPGAFVVLSTDSKTDKRIASQTDNSKIVSQDKPYFIGINSQVKKEALPDFQWNESEGELKKTALNQTHKKLGGRMVPFAGWEMPVVYTSIFEEHLATRNAAGLFDVSHMGVYDIRGADAASFLDAVCGNDCGGLHPGESLYTHFLTPDADVIDDTLVYRRGWDNYLVVVNASNDDKVRTWWESVRDGKVKIDNARPWTRTYGYDANIRNLRDPRAGSAMRVDIALQGPKSRDILLAMGMDEETKLRVNKLKRTELCDAVVGGFDLIVSRTGYTGEKMAFELFVHPEKSVDLWNTILKVGEQFGVKSIGLGARDSLRTEAGLPLYGHEMGLGSGKGGFDTSDAKSASDYSTTSVLNGRDLGVGEGGFGSYVKTYKPWFIGRDAYIAREKERKGVVIRFTFNEQRNPMAHNGDPVVNENGERIGFVTSSALDRERFQTGQAFVDLKYAKEGTPIGIHQGGKMDRPAGAAKVVSRFAKL